jgi:hypothetical protein
MPPGISSHTDEKFQLGDSVCLGRCGSVKYSVLSGVNFRRICTCRAINMKVLDEMFHPNLQAAHAVRPGFPQRFFVGQLIMSDPIARNHRAGSIRTTPAMDKNGPLLARIQQDQDLANLLTVGRRQTRHRLADVNHTGRLNSSSFLADGMFASRPQVNHCFHAQFGQTAPTGASGLTTPVQVRVHLMKIRNARRFNIASPSWKRKYPGGQQ